MNWEKAIPWTATFNDGSKTGLLAVNKGQCKWSPSPQVCTKGIGNTSEKIYFSRSIWISFSFILSTDWVILPHTSLHIISWPYWEPQPEKSDPFLKEIFRERLFLFCFDVKRNCQVGLWFRAGCWERDSSIEPFTWRISPAKHYNSGMLPSTEVFTHGVINFTKIVFPFQIKYSNSIDYQNTNIVVDHTHKKDTLFQSYSTTPNFGN